MKRYILAMMVFLGMAACGGGGADGESMVLSNSNNAPIKEIENGPEIPPMELSEEKVLTSLFGFGGITSAEVDERAEDRGHEGMRQKVRSIKRVMKERATNGEFSKSRGEELGIAQLLVHAYISILNDNGARLPFERDFLSVKDMELLDEDSRRKVESAERVIVLCQNPASKRSDKSSMSPVRNFISALRYFEKNDKKFKSDNGNEKGWYQIQPDPDNRGNVVWELLDTNHVNWLQQRETVCDFMYFCSNELGNIPKKKLSPVISKIHQLNS